MNYRLYLVSLRLRPVNRRALAPSSPPGNAARIRPTIPSHDGGGKWYQRSNLLRGSGIATRTQATATGVAAAAAAYAHQEATAASEMAAVTQVTVV